MPGLRLFGRRWHTATDTLPLLMLPLFVSHALWFIPWATGIYTVEGTGLQYTCDQGTLLRVANYSLFSLFGLAALNEALLFVLGLRGGPFQTRKRRFMQPLLYLEVAVWVLLLGFTIFSTVVVYSDAVSESCFTNNPCQYTNNAFPLACTDKNGKKIKELPEACQQLLDNGDYYVDTCWINWLALGANWLVSLKRWTVEKLPQWEEQYAGLGVYSAEFNRTVDLEVTTWYYDTFYPGDSADRTYPYKPDTFPCNSATNNSAVWEQELDLNLELERMSASEGNMLMSGFRDIQDYNLFLQEHPDLFRWINNAIFDTVYEATSPHIDLFAEGDIHRNQTEAQDMPWGWCFEQFSLQVADRGCFNFLELADGCTQWAQLLYQPIPKNMRTFFEILVITSWAVLAITGLIIVLAYNAFPEYNDVDSWEGSIKSLSRACCFGGALSETAAVGGSDFTVSREIAKSLNLLFGGIDLDPTDRLLGVYLVSERQHRRRQQDVLQALRDAGVVPGRQRSAVQQLLDHVAPRRRKPSGKVSVSDSGELSKLHSAPSKADAAARSGAPDGGASGGSPAPEGSLGGKGSGGEDGEEAPQAVALEPLAASQQAQQQRRQQQPAEGKLPPSPLDVPAAPAATAPQLQLVAGKLPPSPFDTQTAQTPAAPSTLPARNPGGPAVGVLPRLRHLMLYSHSMLRLRSTLSTRPSDHPLAAVEEGRSGAGSGSGGGASAAAYGGAAVAVEGSEGAEPEQGLAGLPGSPFGLGGAGQAAAGIWQNAAIRVTRRFQPLLTPSGCAGSGALLDPPLSPQAAADIYAGKLQPVDNRVLHEAERISRFAVASYGLQGVIWAKGRRPALCLANANRLVHCLKAPLKLEAKFRKRNFDAIVEITGVRPADLLYVSYTNVAGGVLPYIIMLHRPSKSIVLSVRGTVSMEDLVTDLLSNPVDVSSSKLQLQGWKFVVTGHSLGAAVSTLLGMQLRERFSELECWAFNPPGGLLSWELSQIAQAYCTSIVVGKDVISRLSCTNSKRVVDEMVVSLARCTRPKLKVLADVALGRRKRAHATPDTFCSFDAICPEALQLVEQYYRASALHLADADTTEMYPPGKICFLRPFKGKHKAQTVWDAVWIDAATLMSEGILVTPTMMVHHRLFVLADAFESIFAGEAATQAAAQHEQGEDDLLGG